jgi:hypothetical protein
VYSRDSSRKVLRITGHEATVTADSVLGKDGGGGIYLLSSAPKYYATVE